MHSRGLHLVVVLGSALTLRAGLAYTEEAGYILSIAMNAGKLECKKATAGPKVPSDLVVTLRGAAEDAKVSYQPRAGAAAVGEPVSLVRQTGTFDYKVSLPPAPARPEALALIVEQGGQRTECAVVAIGRPDGGPAPTASPAPDTPGPSDSISDEDLQATEWWAQKGRQRFLDTYVTGSRQAGGAAPAKGGSKRGRNTALTFPKQTEFLVHGPSGAPIPPFPTTISERSNQQLVFIRDRVEQTEVEIAIVNCPEKDLFRIRGTLPGAPAAETKFHDWAAVPIGRTLGCGAGNLIYDIAVHHGDKTVATTSNVHVTEVYHLAATIFYGFDVARQPTFGATNKKVTRTEDAVGPGLRLGFTWFPFGVDYTRMRPINYLLNPFAGFDPTAAKESFIVGNNFTPYGGLSLAIGVSLHRFPVLDGVTEGAAFEGPGAVPTRKEWSRAGRSWYFGVAVDDKVFKAVKGLLGQGK